MSWNETGYFRQLDGKHYESLSESSLTGVKPAPTPITRATGKGARDALDVLAKADAVTFRRGAGVAMYIGRDRHQMRIARLRRLVRHFFGTSDVGICFACQDDRQDLTVWVDGDWSGNAETCKSTSPGATEIGGHTWTWRANQEGHFTVFSGQRGLRHWQRCCQEPDSENGDARIA